MANCHPSCSPSSRQSCGVLASELHPPRPCKTVPSQPCPPLPSHLRAAVQLHKPAQRLLSIWVKNTTQTKTGNGCESVTRRPCSCTSLHGPGRAPASESASIAEASTLDYACLAATTCRRRNHVHPLRDRTTVIQRESVGRRVRWLSMRNKRSSGAGESSQQLPGLVNAFEEVGGCFEGAAAYSCGGQAQHCCTALEEDVGDTAGLARSRTAPAVA